MWFLLYLYIFVAAFLLSVVLTHWARKEAVRWNICDHPGERKIHTEPLPLLGGAAIYATLALIVCAHVGIYLLFADKFPLPWLREQIDPFLTRDLLIKGLGIAGGATMMFVLGLVDDIWKVRPLVKLLWQMVAAALLVLCGVRLGLFLENPWLTSIITVGWIVLITNAFNLLDNMDGLSAGVAGLAALIFFVAVFPTGQTFTCLLLLAFAGSVFGFLWHNFHPAKIIMGDAGSLLCGFFMGAISTVSTFYSQDGASKAAVLVPLIVLGVPIFDTLCVIYLRVRAGQSILLGDKRHFSHRLVDVGLSHRDTVIFIYLVTVVAGLGATVLTQIRIIHAGAILAQAVGIFAIVLFLMRVAERRSRE